MMHGRVVLCVLVAMTAPATATPFDDEPTVRAMKDELARSIGQLHRPGASKPYFISYAVWELQTLTIYADLGALTSSDQSARRDVDVDLRVGDYAFDNSNVLDPDTERFRSPFRERIGYGLPIEANYDADRHALWAATIREYDQATKLLDHKKAVLAKAPPPTTRVPSFSKESRTAIVDTHVRAAPDRTRLEQLAKKLSAVLRTNPDVHEGTVAIEAKTGKQYFVSSEGSASVRPVSLLQIEIRCTARADDGLPVRDMRAWVVSSIDELASEGDMVRQVEDLSRELSAIRTAPVVHHTVAPVVFDGLAAGQVVRALLAENLVGTPARVGERPAAKNRTSTRLDGDTELANDVGNQILPAGTRIVDDPTIGRLGTAILVGGYHFDAEGIAAQPVTLVENGTLQQFLMSRTPRPGFDHSNGHATGRAYRAGPTNLLVSSTKAASSAEMRRRVLALAKNQPTGYVLVVEQLAGDELDRRDLGWSSYPRSVFPHATVAKRVYADGREEWVRGATLSRPSLTDLVLLGGQPTVYSWGKWKYATSIAAPALLFQNILVSPIYPDDNEQPSIVARPQPP